MEEYEDREEDPGYKKQVPQSVWEKKDRRIARMSCIKSAVEFYASLQNKEERLELDDEGATEYADQIIAMAKRFEDYVYE